MGKRILIVDDEAPVRDLLREALSSHGFEVDDAHDAAAALELVRDNLYDAAILDFALPDMNGIMLHNEIRRMDQELAGRTLFISGLAQTETDLSYYISAGSGFLSKPFDVRDVIAEVEKLAGDD